MKIGLTLGKFAPLHRGHQRLIEAALGEVDHLIVLIYEAADTRVPLTKRAHWIRTLYPRVEVIEVRDGPTEVGDRPEVTAMHDAFLRTIVGDRGITHFFSAEFYGDHVSRALGAIDRRLERGALAEHSFVPIRSRTEGTSIRSSTAICSPPPSSSAPLPRERRRWPQNSQGDTRRCGCRSTVASIGECIRSIVG